MLADFPCPLQVLPLRKTYDRQAMRVAFTLRSIIRRDRVRIVHSFFETSDLWAGAIAKLSGCPVLVSSRRDMGIQRSAKHRLAYRFLGPMFNEVQTVSEAVRRYCIASDRLPQSKVRTVYNGVNVTPGQRVHPKVKDPAAPVITTVGHIRKLKGFDVFIRAASEVCRFYPLAEFRIVGGVEEPEHFKELQQLCKSLQIESNVKFMGVRHDVNAILADSDIFCLFSRTEGLSNALLEAMAAGLPCVATDVGGNAELLSSNNGSLIASEDHVAAARELLSLIRDPELALGQGLRSLAAVKEQFSEAAMMSELVRSYERLLCQL